MEPTTISVLLPFSEYTVTLKTRLTWDEKQAIEGIVTQNTTTENRDGKPHQVVDGASTQPFLRKMMETFVTHAVNKEGQEVQINIELGKLDADDGETLQLACLDLWNKLKKK